MNYDEAMNRITTNLESVGTAACIATLADIVADMYLTNDVDSDRNVDYVFDEDKEVGGADLVEQVGHALLEGGLDIKALLLEETKDV